MVSRDELRRKYKLKILLRGPAGCGKTFSGVKVAEEVARRGWKVLYLDKERGSEEELLKLDDKILENIIHEDFRNYKQITEAIEKHISEQKDKLKLIVIDPLPLVELARLSARDAFLDQGYYYLGEKKVDIDTKATFDLRGFMYQVSTSYQLKLLDDLATCSQDILVTLMTPNKHEVEYDGAFSIVMELYSAWVANQIFYKAIPKKFRGVDLNSMPAIDNPYKKLLEGFIKKYDTIGSPNGAKVGVKVEVKEDEKKEVKEEENRELKDKNKEETKPIEVAI